MKSDAMIGARTQARKDVDGVSGHRGCRFARGPMDWSDHKNQLASVGQRLARMARDLANVLQVVTANAEAIPRSLNHPLRVAESARRIERRATLGGEIARQMLAMCSVLYPRPATDCGAVLSLDHDTSRTGVPVVAAHGTAQPYGVSEVRDTSESIGVRIAPEGDQGYVSSVCLARIEKT